MAGGRDPRSFSLQEKVREQDGQPYMGLRVQNHRQVCLQPPMACVHECVRCEQTTRKKGMRRDSESNTLNTKMLLVHLHASSSWSMFQFMGKCPFPLEGREFSVSYLIWVLSCLIYF